jgi:excisionase family DNA binding protein
MVGQATFNITEAARFLGVNRVTVYKYIGAGLIPYVVLNTRRRIVKTDLEALLSRKVRHRLRERGRFVKMPEEAPVAE